MYGLNKPRPRHARRLLKAGSTQGLSGNTPNDIIEILDLPKEARACGLSSEELIGFVEDAQLIEADEFLNDPGIWLEIGIHDGGHAVAVEVLTNLMRRVWRIPDGDLRGATVPEFMIGYGVFGGLNRANRGGPGHSRRQYRHLQAVESPPTVKITTPRLCGSGK